MHFDFSSILETTGCTCQGTHTTEAPQIRPQRWRIKFHILLINRQRHGKPRNAYYNFIIIIIIVLQSKCLSCTVCIVKRTRLWAVCCAVPLRVTFLILYKNICARHRGINQSAICSTSNPEMSSSFQRNFH